MPITTLPLSHPDALDPARCGGKAATLARLLAAGFPVPGGVVIPCDLLTEWTPGMQPPGEVVGSIGEVLELLGDGPLAVRSSAVDEDGADASFAGIYTTTLNVSGMRGVLAAIEAGIASRFAAPAHAYRGEAPPPMAILMQPMLRPLAAGVAFSADPVTGDRDVVRVSAVAGLGDGVVSGEVIPDEWEVREQVATRLADVGAAALDAERVHQVAQLAKQIETHEGRPQDIEWAIVEDGRVMLLQARPITVLPQPPAEVLSGANWEKDTAHFPEQVTPYGADLYERGSSAGITAMCETYGLLLATLETHVVGGEVYNRPIPVIGSPDSTAKPPPAPLLGIASRLVPALRRRMRAAQRALADGLIEEWPRRWEHGLRDEFLAQIDRFLDIDLGSLDDEALCAHGSELFAFLERGSDVHFKLTVPYFVALYELDRAAQKLLGWPLAETIQLLESPASVATRGLEECRAAVQVDPALAEALRRSPSNPTAVFREHAPALAPELEHWLARQGWRTVNYDPGAPTIAERPGLLTTLLLADGDRATTHVAEQRLAEARSRLRGTDLARFETALDIARRIYPVREDNVILTDNLPCGLLRRWLVEAARRLVRRGVIARLDDAAYLYQGELVAALSGEASDVAATAARRRAEWAWTRAHPGPGRLGPVVPPPDVSWLPRAGRLTNGAVLWAMQHEWPAHDETELPDGALSGTAVSAGTYRGPARVIRGEADFPRLQSGDVLVCPVTTPAWSVLFALAGAVVADGGGVLSHAAIVAREHGIPAVLGTITATTTLQDGQLVEVDGTQGTVRVLDA